VHLPAQIDVVEYLGHEELIHAQSEGHEIVALVPSDKKVQAGEEVVFAIPVEKLHVFDPETEVCVTCGSTEAMIASMLGVLDPGDEVVVFEPFYENYRPDLILTGAVPRLVTLRPPDWTFDETELRAAFGPRTRAIVIK